MLEQLLSFQKKIHKWLTNCVDGEWMDWYGGGARNMDPQLYFMQRDDLFDITFFGMGEEDYKTRSSAELFEEEFSAYPFVAFLELLSQQEIANRIISLRFEAPDEGANGTKEWDFKRLVDSGVTFPNLRHFSVGLTEPTDHNSGIMVLDVASGRNKTHERIRILRSYKN